MEIQDTKSNLASDNKPAKVNLRDTQRSVPQVYWEWNIETGEHLWSHNIFQPLDLLSESTITSHEMFLASIYPHDRKYVECLLNQAIHNDKPYNSNYRIMSADGKMHVVRDQGKVILRDEMGAPTRMIGVIQEIIKPKKKQTEKQQMKQRLRQVQKMAMLGQFTGGMVHDFNNILECIKGYSGLLQDECRVGNEHNLLKYTNEIDKACERAEEMTSHMLAFCRDDAVKPNRLLLHSMVNEVVEMLRPIFPPSIRLQAQLNKEDTIISMDPTGLQQVLLNLCINARDAMLGKGTIVIEQNMRKLATVCDSCNTHFEGQFVELIVSDSGSGITPDKIKQIFTPFFTTKKPGESTGIGLWMVNNIMHEYDGHVLVESGSKKGCQFSLLFPVVDYDVPNSDKVQIPKNNAMDAASTMAITC